MIMASVLILSGSHAGISHFVLSEGENLLRTKLHTPREQAANRTLGVRALQTNPNLMKLSRWP